MDWERWYTLDPKGIPSDEAYEYYNLAISLGYKEYLQKEFGRSIYYYNQDYRSPPNMKHAKEYALSKDDVPAYGGTIEYVMSKSPPNIPDISTSQLTEKSVSINFNPTGTGGSPITGYHYVLRNEITGEEKQKDLMSGQRNSYESNLDSGTNYKAFIIAFNAMGNSPENSISFKTTGIKVITPPVITPPVVVPPVVTTPSFVPSDLWSTEVRTILTKFDNNDYTFPSWFNNNIGYVKDGSITGNEFLAAFNNLLQAGTIIDKTIPVEETFCVIVYQVNEFGGVYPTSYPEIKLEALKVLEATYLVKNCSDLNIPTDQEVKDFYGFEDLTTSPNMVSQSIGPFKLENGKVTGDIIYIAEGSPENPIFNPYYYNKPLYSIVTMEDQAGRTIQIGEPKGFGKINNLNFTATERDETISINEDVGDVLAVQIKFFVDKNPIPSNNPLSLMKTQQVVCVECLPPCPVGFTRDFNGKCIKDGGTTVGGKTSLLGKFMGVTALIGTLALLGSKGR